MPITYTNRKGQTYTLCQGLTKTGKPRYYFASAPSDNAPGQIPAGYHIEESVNGVVSLVKDRPQPIRPEEISVVEKALGRHPKAGNYRAAAKGKQIIVYERVGPDFEELSELFSDLFPPLLSQRQNAARQRLEDRAQFTPILRFHLLDPVQRSFWAERKTYVVSLPDWVGIGSSTSLPELVQEIIPLLDTDDFFEIL